jgi:hypothetical protein
MDTGGEGLDTGGLDRGQAIGQHRRQNLDHLAVTIIRALQTAPQPLQPGRQRPVLERRAVSERAGLSGQHRHVMPRVVDRLAAAEAAAMLADDHPVLADHDVVGVSLNLDRPADGTGADRVLVIVEAHQAGLGYRRRHRAEPVERTGDRYQLGALGLEGLPDRALGRLWVLVRLGVGDAAIEQEAVQFVVARHPQPRREKALAHQPNLVLDLALLPARRRSASNRLDQVMPANPQKAAVELAILADEHGIDRRPHIVVDATRAGAPEEGEGAVVRVEHHLLGLARIGPHEQHAAVAQPDMRHLDRHRHPVDQHDLV